MSILKNIYRKTKRFAFRIFGKEPWYKNQIYCEKEYYGNEFARWCICPTKICKDSIIYSFGVGEDISFDLSLIKHYNVHVFAFDPTPKSIEWVKSQTIPKEFHLFEFGLADYDGKAKFNPPENPQHISYTLLSRLSTNQYAIEADVYTLKTIMGKLHHEKIDILKMDIEGAEYSVIDDILNSELNISQILVEFHHRFANVGIDKTKRAIRALNEGGYRIFNISDNGEEYSFIKEEIYCN